MNSPEGYEGDDKTPEWRVLIETTASGWVTVEAPTEDDARKWAVQSYKDGDLLPEWEWATAVAIEAEVVP